MTLIYWNGGGCSALILILGGENCTKTDKGGVNMNDLINAVLGMISLLICVALIDKLIELFKNIKK